MKVAYELFGKLEPMSERIYVPVTYCLNCGEPKHNDTTKEYCNDDCDDEHRDIMKLTIEDDEGIDHDDL